MPETDVWLRLTPAGNNQQIKIRLAEEHTLAAWAARQQLGVVRPTPVTVGWAAAGETGPAGQGKSSAG